MKLKMYEYEFIINNTETRYFVFNLNKEIVDLFREGEIVINDYFNFNNKIKTSKNAMEKIMYYLPEGDLKNKLQKQINNKNNYEEL